MITYDDDTILAELSPSTARRGFALCVLGGLACLLIILAATQPTPFFWRMVLLGLGVVAAWAGWQIWRATVGGLVLKGAGLFQSDGQLVAAFDNVTGADRGMFAFKPSNGFILKLRQPQPFGWAPGLWWRIGNRVGVGGVTSAGEAKAMAEIVTAMLVTRDGME